MKPYSYSGWAIEHWMVIGAVCLFFAFFFAWRVEHTSRLALRDSGLPKLCGSIEQAAIMQLPGGKTGIMLWVAIRNLGAPSTADNYTLQYYSSDGSHFDLPLHASPPEVVFGDMKMDTSQGAIYDKTAEQPIPTGGIRRGIAFSRTDLPAVAFRDATRFILTFNDITEKAVVVTSADIIQYGYNSPPNHVPGSPDAK